MPLPLLTANVSALAANVVAGDKAIQAEIAALTAAMATDDTDAIEAAVLPRSRDTQRNGWRGRRRPSCDRHDGAD